MPELTAIGEREKPERWFERYRGMNLHAIIDDLQKGCAVKSKRNANGVRNLGLAASYMSTLLSAVF